MLRKADTSASTSGDGSTSPPSKERRGLSKVLAARVRPVSTATAKKTPEAESAPPPAANDESNEHTNVPEEDDGASNADPSAILDSDVSVEESTSAAPAKALPSPPSAGAGSGAAMGSSASKINRASLPPAGRARVVFTSAVKKASPLMPRAGIVSPRRVTSGGAAAPTSVSTATGSGLAVSDSSAASPTEHSDTENPGDVEQTSPPRGRALNNSAPSGLSIGSSGASASTTTSVAAAGISISASASSIGGLTANKESSSGAGAVSAAEDGRGYDINKQLPLPRGFRNRFAQRDSDDNILFLDKGAAAAANAAAGGDMVDAPVLKGGTLVKLVERLTLPEHGDPAFLRTFLLTYRSFTTSLELLQLLVNRFYCEIEDDSSMELRRSVQKPVRLRVLTVLKVWVTSYSYDFLDNPELVGAFEKFCQEEIASIMSSGSRQLLTLLEKALSQEEMSKKSTPISAKEIPRPHLPTCRPSELGMLTIHPQEFARQLTIIEAELFRAIKPWELLNLSWSRKDKEQRAPNVLAMIARSNVITPWVASQVVSSKSMKVRAEVLTRCIQTMVYLEELHNFNGIMEFMAALQNAGVFRLKETWARLDKKWSRAWGSLIQRMSRDNNYKIYRESMRTVSPPCIPYLGLFLTDLTFIEEAPDFIDEEKGIINVIKRAQYAQVIKDIQLYQQTPYLLQAVPVLSDFMLQLNPPTQEQVYDVSLTLKPRAEGSKEIDEEAGTTPGAKAGSAGSRSAASSSGAVPAAKVDADNWGDLDFPPGYPFTEPDTDDNIDVDEENHKLVLYASIPKLVERLTYEKYSDQTFVSSFLLTHYLMMPSEKLMDLLIARYNVPFPKKCDADTRTKYDAKVVRPVRLRVFNALKQWVDKYPKDFLENEVLSDKLEKFAEGTMKATGMQKPAERLLEGLSMARVGGVAEDAKKSPRKPAKTPPAVIVVPKNGSVRETPFYELPALEMARQITLMEFKLYHAVTDREVLAWNPPSDHQGEFDRQISCPNLWLLWDHNEWLTSLTVSLIVSQQSKHVAQTIEQFVFVADSLRQLNNFNGFGAVVEGLLKPEIAGLESAWVALSPKAAKTFDALKDLLDEIKTYYKNQQWMQKVSAPALPSLKSYLDELARIELGTPDRISEAIHPGKLEHMAKRLQQAKTVTDYLVFQGSDFVFEEVPDYEEVLKGSAVLSEEDIAANVARLTTEVAEDDTANMRPTTLSKGSATSTSSSKLLRPSATTPSTASNAKTPIKPSPSTTPSVRASTEQTSPQTSPRSSQMQRSSINVGSRRNTGRSADIASAAEFIVTKEWVENYVQNAVRDAVAPLVQEIERLKILLEQKTNE